MDKKWRNLLLFVVIIAVLVVGYLYFFQNSLFLPVVEEKSIDLGYDEILSLFEKNDVNIENVQTLNMVYIDDDGVINWVEKKSNLLSVKRDLISFKSNLNGYHSEDKSELEGVATIYIHAIDFAVTSEQRFNSIVSIIQGDNFNCSNLSVLSDLNNLVSWNYVDKYNLAAEVDDFAYNYDPYSEILTIDLDSEYAYLLYVHDSINSTIYDCSGGFD